MYLTDDIELPDGSEIIIAGFPMDLKAMFISNKDRKRVAVHDVKGGGYVVFIPAPDPEVG